MSELGVFAVDRGVFDHPLLANDQPYSRREAWLWLVSEAAWKPRTVGRAGAVIELERGQLAHSIRFMAEAWGWSKSSVDRFLTRLKTGTMIETDAGTGVVVITICNYDAYQRVSLPDRDSTRDEQRDTSGTAPGQTKDIQTIKEDIISEPEAGSDLSKPKSTKRPKNAYTPEYEAFWKAYPSTEGQSKLDGFKAWQKLSPEQQTQAMASLPSYAALLQKSDGRAVKHVQGYLNGRMFESFAAASVVEDDEPTWRRRLIYARDQRIWSTAKLGPLPGQPGCRVPANLLQPGDGEGWQEARAA